MMKNKSFINGLRTEGEIRFRCLWPLKSRPRIANERERFAQREEIKKIFQVMCVCVWVCKEGELTNRGQKSLSSSS